MSFGARRPLTVLPVVFAAVTSFSRPAAAHDVPTEAIVQMSVIPEGTALRINVRVPSTLLADANLPKLEDGSIDAPASQPVLELVAGDVARNLDVWEDQSPLGAPMAHARVDSDPTVVAFTFDYRIASDRDRFSARLNGFRSTTQRVRTVAHVFTSTGATRTFSVTGNPERVFFDPRWTQTARRFAVLGLRRLLESNQLWFLFALVVPLRKYATVATAFVALVAGESTAILASAWGVATPSPAFLVTVETAVAVTLIFIGVQNITHSQTRWVWPVALWFGLVDGFSVGATVRDSVQFAASHVALSIVAFGLALVAGQLWVIVLARPVVGIVHRWTRSEQMAAAILSAPVIHAGLQGVIHG
jgi:hypothetical protein